MMVLSKMCILNDQYRYVYYSRYHKINTDLEVQIIKQSVKLVTFL